MLTSSWRPGMSTSPRKKVRSRRGFVPKTALARSVEFDAHMMRITLMDGRELGVPLAWFPTLKKATAVQRARCEIGGGGVGLHWPDLDEDLSIAGLMAGVDLQSL